MVEDHITSDTIVARLEVASNTLELIVKIHFNNHEKHRLISLIQMSSSIYALETSQPQNCTLALHGVFVVMGRHQYIYVINEHAWLFSTTEHCNSVMCSLKMN